MIITADLIETHVLREIPSTAYTILREDSRNGPVTRITPVNPNAAQLNIWVEGGGWCDIFFGRAFSLELDLERGEDLIELALGAIDGHLIDQIWSIGNHRLYSKSVIRKRNGQSSVFRNGIPLPYPPWLRKTCTYEPFITT